MRIIWRDIFKPRYGVIVEVVDFPVFGESSRTVITHRRSPAVVRLPVKRPLSVPFNEFYNSLGGPGTMRFCGSRRVLSKIYGIGSTEKNNLKRATKFKRTKA